MYMVPLIIQKEREREELSEKLPMMIPPEFDGAHWKVYFDGNYSVATKGLYFSFIYPLPAQVVSDIFGREANH